MVITLTSRGILLVELCITTLLQWNECSLKSWICCLGSFSFLTLHLDIMSSTSWLTRPFLWEIISRSRVTGISWDHESHWRSLRMPLYEKAPFIMLASCLRNQSLGSSIQVRSFHNESSCQNIWITLWFRMCFEWLQCCFHDYRWNVCAEEYHVYFFAITSLMNYVPFASLSAL